MKLAALGLWLALGTACADATGSAREELSDPGPSDASTDRALAFDGVDDYASAGTARMPQIERPQTLMLWVMPATVSDLQVLLTLRRSRESGIVLCLDQGVPFVYNVFGPRDLARAQAPLSVEQWHHVAYVNSTDGSHLYVDGLEQTTEPGPKPATNRTPLLAFIGSLDGYGNMFHGSLDELRVYDRAFNSEEVAAIAAGQRPDAEPLVLYLPFDEASGARSYDRSGLGNHAELGDGVSELMPERVGSSVPHQ